MSTELRSRVVERWCDRRSEPEEIFNTVFKAAEVADGCDTSGRIR